MQELTKLDIKKEKIEELTSLFLNLLSANYGEHPTIIQMMTTIIALEIISDSLKSQLSELGYTCGVTAMTEQEFKQMQAEKLGKKDH